MDELEFNAKCSYSSWTELNSYFVNENFSVLCLNARSITHKFPELLAHLASIKQKFSTIIIIETWLKKETDIALEIAGYRSKSMYRDLSKGGGIKVFYLENDTVTRMFLVQAD